MDVLAHEYTHAVTQHTANLNYLRESGAINESISDIFGQFFEDYMLGGGNANYLIGEDAGPGLALRDMADPPSIPNNGNLGQVTQPDIYQGNNWFNQNGCTPIQDNDHCGVHTNSGVMNKWYWYVRTGGPTGTAFDAQKPARSVYRSLQYYLHPNSNYADVASATRQSAIDIYGSCSDVAKQVVYAWGLEGINVNPPCNVDCNSIALNPTISPVIANPGQSISMSSNMTGDSKYLNLAHWTGPNYSTDEVGVGYNATTTAPTTPGTYSYTFWAGKSGCSGLFGGTVIVNVQNTLPLTNGCYTIKAKHSNKLMQPENNNNGARIRQYGTNGQTNQIFELEAVDGTAYKIISKSSNKVWDAAGAGTGNGTAINQYDWNNGNNQKWYLGAWGDGTYKIEAKHAPGQLVDVEGVSTGDGAGLHLWASHGGDNQRYYFSSVSCTTNPTNCDFNISASNTNNNPSPNQSLQLNYACSGADCGGVNYAWSGNGIIGNSSPLNINAPGNNGSYTYTVTASKNGCSNKTTTTSITVGNTLPACNCGFSLTSATQKSGQYTASFQFNSCSVSQINWSILSGSTVIASGSENVTAATVPFTVPASVNTGNYTLQVDVVNCSGTGTTPFNYTKPGGGSTSFSQCLESESSNGNGAITGDPNASNGQTRGSENNNNHYVDYAITSVPSAGTYYAKLRYYSSTAPVVGVQVNGGSTQNVNLNNSGSWNIVWTEQTIPVSLNSGNNTIRISGVSGGSCRQDRLCVNSNANARINFGTQTEVINISESPEPTESEILQVSPNPNTGTFEVKFDLAIDQKASLSVYEISGKAIYEQKLTGKGKHQEKVVLADHASGIYLVELRKANGVKVKKTLVIK